MMIGNTNDPTGAATPIVGPGNNSCTDCITIDLPMDEIRQLKAEGWSNVKIAKKYGVADVTIGYRLKKDAEQRAAEKAAEPVQTDGKRPLDIADLRARREAGETYEHIGREYGGWTEDEVHAFIIQKGKEERNGQD